MVEPDENPNEVITWIEGVGGLIFPLHWFCPSNNSAPHFKISCYIKNDQVLFMPGEYCGESTSSVNVLDDEDNYLYPNPVFDNLYINNDENIEEVCLYNISGNLLNSYSAFPINFSSYR